MSCRSNGRHASQMKVCQLPDNEKIQEMCFWIKVLHFRRFGHSFDMCLELHALNIFYAWKREQISTC